MILSGSLKKPLFISLIGHIVCFSIFSFSFGDRILKADYASVSFQGAILNNSDLINRPFLKFLPIKNIFKERVDILKLDKTNKAYPAQEKYYSKPAVNLALSEDKINFIPKEKPASFASTRKESVIMFYPQLPYHFLLYFKDRQIVHIELKFNIVVGEGTNSILIKRKISSGNLEADLLAMRYVEHYLFIQQKQFSLNNWQTVKIDLSAKNDQH